MKYIVIFILLFLIFSCSNVRKVYLCGDHECVDSKERETYFKKTMSVEVKNLKNKKKNSSQIELIKKKAGLSDEAYEEESNNLNTAEWANNKQKRKDEKKIAKKALKDEKKRIKEDRKLAKKALKDEKKRIKEEKRLFKKNIKEQEKKAEQEKKIAKKKIDEEKKVVINTGFINATLSSS